MDNNRRTGIARLIISIMLALAVFVATRAVVKDFKSPGKTAYYLSRILCD
jgi:hypothetical protein